MKRRIAIKKKRITRRRKKSIFSNFYFSFSVFASIIVLSVAGFLLFSPRFQISQLNISGNNKIATEDLEKVVQEKLKTSFSFLGIDMSTESIFLSLGDRANSLIEAFPEIEKVTIKKNFPNGVSLQIVEKTPYAIWTDDFDDSKCYLVDKNGSYIKKYVESEEYSSLIKINEKEEIKDLDRKMILENLSKIETKLKNNKINISDFDLYEEKLVVKSNLACKIYFNIDDDLNWQIEKLEIVLGNTKYSDRLNSFEYIDLRFGNQAIIK
ncbi:MAG: FtsQ-type POTRA domain-containing protein [Candidatus Paceibacterota bacterium]|jgi:cell division septal protein FtsQ